VGNDLDPMLKPTSHPRLAAAALALVALVSACSAAAVTPAPASPSADATPTTTFEPIPTVNPNPTNPPWFDVELTDVNSGSTFRISDFAGKVVLVEMIAVWCPTCQGEMSQVQQLHETYGQDGDLITVTLDVDVNEDAPLLKKFAETNKFTWRIAIAPAEIGRFMAANYDPNYINPPTQPMLIIDKKGGVWGLPFGIKSATSLQKTLDRYLAE
jgi:thiol-disulfide isomerase/thioredoxin